MNKSMLLFSFVALAIALSMSACTKKPAPTLAEMTPEQILDRGKLIYASSCTSCHHRDPNLDGAIGPAVAGASHELLEARLVRGEYPQGYRPKRDTKAMVAMPHLKNEIPAITAYLASIIGKPL